MKRTGILFLCTLFILLAAGTLAPGAVSAEDQVFKWQMATPYPRGTAFEALYHDFVEKVRIMSNGRLIIEDKYSGEGVSQTEVLGAVKTGLVPMGCHFTAFHTGEIPAGVVEVGLPGGPADKTLIMALMHDGGWLKELRRIYAEQGLYYLGVYFQPGPVVMTKKPINSIEDFKGLKIRAPGAYGKLFHKLGATPVVINWSEIYTSLATGVIDGVDGMNMIDHYEGKFFEQAKYLYPLPVAGYQMLGTIVNMDDWNKLPDDLKAILEMASVWHGELQAYKSAIWERDALNEMLAKGLQISPTPSEADKKAWIEAGRSLWEEYAQTDPNSKILIDLERTFLEKMGK